MGIRAPVAATTALGPGHIPPDRADILPKPQRTGKPHIGTATTTVIIYIYSLSIYYYDNIEINTSVCVG